MFKFSLIIFVFFYTSFNSINAQFYGLDNVISRTIKIIQPINKDTVEGFIDFFSPSITYYLSPLIDYFFDNGVTSTYNVRTTSEPTQDEYDFIIIGAGTAGAAVANRLSEKENWRILLLEAGGIESTMNQVPLFFAMAHQTDYNYGYRIEQQKNACFGMTDKLCTWPRGKSLGGSSSINAMIHTRGNKLDYDLWAKMGNKGWAYKDVLPYFIKSENFHATDGPWDTDFHGTDGYVCVQNNPYRTPLADAFLNAGKEIGYDIVDYNGEHQIGFGYLQANLDKGARCSSARAYLRVDRSNLDIVTDAFVTKILIDDEKRAYGVEYVKGGYNYTINATKEVISSAGTVNGARLLMLSGIGPKEHLEEFGIPVIKDAKVGFNMYEHVATWGLVFTTNATTPVTITAIANPINVADYFIDRNGPLSLPAASEALGYVRTKYAPDERPDVELLFINGALSSDKGLTIKPSYGISDEVYDQFFGPLEYQYVWSVWPVVQHPKSVGRITLRSADPFDPPKLDPNLFSDPMDLEIILEAIKVTINMSQTLSFQQYNSQIYNQTILGCEDFIFGTDDYFRCLIKTIPVMENHEMGTAKMGAENDPTAVVDPELRVYGIKGLRVIDASIMPTMTVGHINAGVYMIGEKGADMIKDAWKDN